MYACRYGQQKSKRKQTAAASRRTRVTAKIAYLFAGDFGIGFAGESLRTETVVPGTGVFADGVGAARLAQNLALVDVCTKSGVAKRLGAGSSRMGGSETRVTRYNYRDILLSGRRCNLPGTSRRNCPPCPCTRCYSRRASVGIRPRL